MIETPARFVCVRCFNVDEVIPVDRLRCTTCGHSVKAKEYAEAFVAAHRSVAFGLHYSKKFSEQYAHSGRITVYYAIAPPEGWYVFCAMAAISGIVGNLAYDIIKAAIKRIWMQRKKPDPDCFPTGLDLSKDADIAVFVEGIHEFYAGLPSMPPPVRDAVFHEIETEIMLPTVNRRSIELLAAKEESAEIAKKLAELLLHPQQSSPLAKAIAEVGAKTAEIETLRKKKERSMVEANAIGPTKAKAKLKRNETADRRRKRRRG